MASLRRIRDRIRGVKNIEQITRAMKMVASARLRKAQAQLLQARPYAYKLQGVMRDIAGHSAAPLHPLLQQHPQAPAGIMVFTSDKGLCAGFNAQPLQRVGKQLAEAQTGRNPEVLALGRKALDFFRRAGVKPYREWAGFWQELNWAHADAIGNEVIQAYRAGRWSSISLVYNRFKSMLAQEVVAEPLLPIPPMAAAAPGPDRFREYTFEPSADEIAGLLLPRYVKMSIWHALLESKAAELAARMQAMDNASISAAEMIDDLKLHMNRARQAAITREISELVSSAEAINA